MSKEKRPIVQPVRVTTNIAEHPPNLTAYANKIACVKKHKR